MATISGIGSGALVERDADARGRRDLVERGAPAPPRVGSRSTCRSGVTASIAATRPCERLAVAADLGAELEALAHAHDRDPVDADVAADDDHVAGLGAVGPDVDARRAPAPMPAVLT